MRKAEKETTQLDATAWRTDFETGIAELDAGNRFLFERLAAITPNADRTDVGVFCAQIEAFEALSRAEFAVEILLMETCQYASKAMHLNAHDYLSAEIKHQISDLQARRTTQSAAFGVIARSLYQHVANLDTDLGKAVAQRDAVEGTEFQESHGDAEDPFDTPRTTRIGDYPVIVWTSIIEVGVEAIDTDHKVLIALYNNIIAAEKANDKEKVARLLEELGNQTEAHFRREEDLMQQHAYPFRATHRKEHQRLLEELACEIEDWRDGQISSASLVKFMHGWLLRHIVDEDTPMANSICDK